MSPVTQNEITLFNDAFNKSPRGDCQQLQIASKSGMVAGDFDVSESFRKGYSSMKKSVGLGIVLCFAIVLAGCAKEEGTATSKNSSQPSETKEPRRPKRTHPLQWPPRRSRPLLRKS